MSGWSDVGLPPGWRLVVLDEVDSSNSEVLRRAEREDEGLVVVAERQSAGRGRRGAAWFSESGDSLTFSLLLKPAEARALWPRLSLVAGLAVAEALGRFGVEAEIKWPNDILVGGRKICGILVEAGPAGAVLGIGLNVGSRRFPDGLAATSLWLETMQAPGRDEVLSTLLHELRGISNRIGSEFPAVVARIRRRCALSGKRVRLSVGEGRLEGTVVEVGGRGELVLENDSGRHQVLQAHEVRVID